MPAGERQVAAGEVTLSCQMDGPAQGDTELVIAAHGFPDGPGSFDLLAEALVASGRRVARPAMRGYAPSGIPRDGRYDAAALGNDLIAVADALSPDRPVLLVGHDWGAVAAYAACAIAPARVRRVVTMAVPHLRQALPRWFHPAQLRRSWYMAFFQLRGLAETWLAREGMANVERLWRDWSPGYRCPPARMTAVKAGMRGRLSEVLGYYRAMVRPSRHNRVTLAKTQVPALYLHGEDDGCVGVEIAEGTEGAFTAGLSIERVADAGHFLHLERPTFVNRRIVAFFDEERP